MAKHSAGRKGGAACIVIGIILIALYFLLPTSSLYQAGKQPLPNTIATLDSVGTIGNETTGFNVINSKTYLTYSTISTIVAGTTTEDEWNQQEGGGGWLKLDLLVYDSVVIAPFSVDTASDTIINILKSTDGGGTFTKVEVANISNARDSDAVRIFKSGDTIYLYLLGTDFHTQQDYRAWLWTSTDDGATWTGPTYQVKLKDLVVGADTLTGGNVMETYFNGSKLHLLIRAWSGVYESSRTYYTLYAYTTNFQSYTYVPISQSTLGFSSREFYPRNIAMAASGNTVVFTAMHDSDLYWHKSADGGLTWTFYKYSSSQEDWLTFGAPLTVTGGKIYAWWVSDGPGGNPSLMRWDGVDEPLAVVEYSQPTVKSLTVTRAITEGDKTYVLSGAGYNKSAGTFDDLLILTEPPEGAEAGLQISAEQLDWLRYLAAIFIIIGVLLIFTSAQRKAKKPTRKKGGRHSVTRQTQLSGKVGAGIKLGAWGVGVFGAVFGASYFTT